LFSGTVVVGPDGTVVVPAGAVVVVDGTVVVVGTVAVAKARWWSVDPVVTVSGPTVLSARSLVAALLKIVMCMALNESTRRPLLGSSMSARFAPLGFAANPPVVATMGFRP
jgi:hypothetical protein